MGFSLSRALAGAVVGAAGAATKMFDEGFAEEAKIRAEERGLEKAKEVARFTDELTSAREQRVDEMKAQRAVKDRETLALATKDARASLSEKGIKFGSPEGQFAMAEDLVAKGYAEFGNKFFDNGQNMLKAANDNETKKLIAEGNRIARQARTDAQADKTDAKGADMFKTILNGQDRIIRDVDGKEIGKDTAVKNVIASFTTDLVRKDAYGAAQMASKLAEKADAIRAANPKATEYQVATALRQQVDSLMNPTPGAPPAAAPAAIPQPAQQKKRIPGIFERGAEAADAEMGEMDMYGNAPA